MPSVDDCSSAMLTVCPSNGIKGIISLSRLSTEGEEEYEGEYYNASLLDTMQIVAPDPVKQRPSVPNHILNTSKLNKLFTFNIAMLSSSAGTLLVFGEQVNINADHMVLIEQSD